MAMLTYAGRKIELAGAATIGRTRECEVMIADGAASRQHARIVPEAGGWWIEDLGSANGTRRNDDRVVGRMRLRNGDAIRIGTAEIVFHCSEREAGQAAVRIDPQSLANREIAGYRIGKLLGRSGLGFLYQAEQASLRRTVAFKIFSRSVVNADPRFGERFRELAAKASAIVHDAFVAIHDVGCEDGLPWYAMELVIGDGLVHLLEREGALPPEMALLICERAALAMEVAHRGGLVHRDLSLRTIMLTAEGKVRITDLGIAAELGRGRDRLRPDIAWHASPEAFGDAAPRPADDVYSLGCVLYHLLAGRPPFPGANATEVLAAHARVEIPALRRVLPELPAAADELLQGMLTKNRDWRLADMAEVAARLRALRGSLTAGDSAQESAAGMVGRSLAAGRSRIDRRPSSFLVLAIVAVVLVGCAALLLPSLLAKPIGYLRPSRSAAPDAGAAVEGGAAGPSAAAQQTAAVDRDLAAVLALRARLGEGATAGWAGIEADIEALGRRLAAGSQGERELRAVRDQLALDAQMWFRAELGRLPPAGGPRLTALSRLRDQAASAERPEAEARYQEELTVLVQRLNAARRQARSELRSKGPAGLPAIAEALAAPFAGTPVAALQQQFAELCRSAAALAPAWQGSWEAMSAGFERARGADALAAGAVLLLAGDPVRAKRVLLDPEIAQQGLSARRQALLGGKAAVLQFDDPAELQWLEIAVGEPVIAGGALTGRSGEAYSLACTIPIGGSDWQVELNLAFAGDQGELVASCVQGGAVPVRVRLGEGATTTVLAGTEAQAPSPVAGQRRLRLSCRAGDLLVVLDGAVLATARGAPVPPGAQLRLELAGSDWRLDDLSVVGGQ